MTEKEYYKVRDSYCIKYDEARKKCLRAGKAYFLTGSKAATYEKFAAMKSRMVLAREAWLASCEEYNTRFGFAGGYLK